MKRVLTAAVLIPVALYAMFGGSARVLLGIVAVTAVLCFYEYAYMLHLDRLVSAIGFLAGLWILFVPLNFLFPSLSLLVLITMILPPHEKDLRVGFASATSMLAGVIYIFGGMKTVCLLGAHGPWWLFFAFVINWIGDSGAYYVGRRFGRHRMAPRISPGKSWEGAAASLVFSTVVAMLLLPRVLPVGVAMAALLAILGNISGQIGDLAESALKRAVGVKDSGKMLPGHGGLLDRLDSTLFTVPVIYTLVNALRL